MGVFLRVLQLLIVLPHKRPENIKVNESLSNVMLEIIMRLQREGNQSDGHMVKTASQHTFE